MEGARVKADRKIVISEPAGVCLRSIFDTALPSRKRLCQRVIFSCASSPSPCAKRSALPGGFGFRVLVKKQNTLRSDSAEVLAGTLVRVGEALGRQAQAAPVIARLRGS